MRHPSAFTLLELLVVTAIIAILAAVILSSLAASKSAAQGIRCLSNSRQLVLAWRMYDDDSRGSYPSNLDESLPHPAGTTWCDGVLSWAYDHADNTNNRLLGQSLLMPYLRSLKVFKCPADTFYCLEGGALMDRVRSVSMNCFVGADGIENGFAMRFTPSDMRVRGYAGDKDLVAPGPADLWLLSDENADSINDGWMWFYCGSNSSYFIDTPSSSHVKSSAMSFADGHAEMHRWQEAWRWPRTVGGVQSNGSPRPFIGEPSTGSDVRWMEAHSTAAAPL